MAPRHGPLRRFCAVAPLGLALLLAPRVALGQSIRNTAHDLSSSSGASIHSTTEGEICKFCHTPHGAEATRLLWNHAQTQQATFTWANPTTFAGTPLPTSSIRPASKKCLGCHDGSVSLGQVRNAGSGAAGTVGGWTAIAGRVDAAGKLVPGNVNLVGFGGDLSGSHPISIPYAGESAYNGISSAIAPSRVVDGTGDYWTARRAGCSNNTGICTNATGGPVDGRLIQLYPNAEGTTTNLGIECTSCHEPHNQFGYRWFMRLDGTTDTLCKGCHNK